MIFTSSFHHPCENRLIVFSWDGPLVERNNESLNGYLLKLACHRFGILNGSWHRNAPFTVSGLILASMIASKLLPTTVKVSEPRIDVDFMSELRTTLFIIVHNLLRIALKDCVLTKNIILLHNLNVNNHFIAITYY